MSAVDVLRDPVTIYHEFVSATLLVAISFVIENFELDDCTLAVLNQTPITQIQK